MAPSAALSAATTKDETDWTAIEALIGRQLAERRQPGMALCVTRAGRPLLAKGFGLASLESGVAMAPLSVCRIGSLTKQFTAAALLLLAEQGKLSLDDPLARFLPDFPRAADLSLRRMLNHTAGLGNYTDSPDRDALLQTLRIDRDRAQLVALMQSSGTLQLFEPGTRWAYSNTAYVLLGAVIEIASGVTCESYFEDHLFKPLGLGRTALDHAADIVVGRASGYVRTPESPTGFTNAPFISMTVPGCAGNLRSTPVDLCAWHAALFGGRILGPASLQAMMEPALLKDGSLPFVPPDKEGPRPPVRYGLGLRLDTERGHRAVGHGGSIPGFSSYLTTLPDQGVSIAIIANAEAAFPEIRALESLILDQLFPA